MDTEKPKSEKVTILITSITVVGGLLTAIVTNWEKIFGHKQQQLNPTHTEQAIPHANAAPEIKQPAGEKNIHYTGKVGKMDARYELYRDANGNIKGSYYYINRPNVSYVLKGKADGDKLELTEYTGSNISANCELNLHGACYTGTMHNTDGRSLTMSMCENQ